jgi:hypothetical protein
MSPSPTLTTNPFEKVLTPPWLRFYEHLPSYGDHIQSEITNTLDDLDQAHFEQLHRLDAYANTMLRGCTLEYFVLECLLGLSKEQPYVQHADVIDKFVEDRLKDLLRDLGELRIPYDRDFNERTRLVCLKQNPSLPALVLDSVSDLKYSFFENLMKAHGTPVFSAQGHPGEGF